MRILERTEQQRVAFPSLDKVYFFHLSSFLITLSSTGCQKETDLGWPPKGKSRYKIGRVSSLQFKLEATKIDSVSSIFISLMLTWPNQSSTQNTIHIILLSGSNYPNSYLIYWQTTRCHQQIVDLVHEYCHCPQEILRTGFDHTYFQSRLSKLHQ